MKLKATFGLILLSASCVVVACGSDDDPAPANTGGSSSGGSSSGGSSSGGSSSGGTAGSSSGGSAGSTAGSGGSVAGSGGSAGSTSAGMPLGKMNPPTPGAQIDRAGRPAITSALIETFNADGTARDTARDAYNADDDPSTWVASHKDTIKGALGILDSLDTNCGNQLAADDDTAGRYEFLATVLADDQLYIDSTQSTCAYLGQEGLITGDVTTANCGGRTPTMDIIETSYSVLAAGELTGVDDTITADDKPADNDTFPFLSAP